MLASYTIHPAAIVFEIDVEAGIDIDVDRAVLCGLMINELATNALKHGFAGDRHGELRIDLVSSGEQLLTLSVANNGQELPADFDVRQVRSMGLNLVMSLVKQIKGDLVVKTGAMTSFEINFPRLV